MILKKILILLIKFIPVIQMAGMLVNNTLYYFDIDNDFSDILDFIIGNSLFGTLLIYICSHTFQFCIWHRLIIISNFINIIIACVDKIIGIPITDMYMLISYYFISSIFIIIATIIHIKRNHDTIENKNNKESA